MGEQPAKEVLMETMALKVRRVIVESLESQEFGDSQETRDQWVTPDSLEIRVQWDPKDQWVSLVILFFKPDEKARFSLLRNIWQLSERLSKNGCKKKKTKKFSNVFLNVMISVRPEFRCL